jgi:hypothetical protein
MLSTNAFNTRSNTYKYVELQEIQSHKARTQEILQKGGMTQLNHYSAKNNLPQVQ